MLRTNFVRRAGRLLGAVTVAGVLSAGVLVVPLAAQASVGDAQVSASHANGLKVVPRITHHRVHFYEIANGI